MNWETSGPFDTRVPSPLATALSLSTTLSYLSFRAKRGTCGAPRSPIPKGKHTANSNRAYLSPDTTVSISGHILFIRSEADLSRRAVEESAVFADLCWKRVEIRRHATYPASQQSCNFFTYRTAAHLYPAANARNRTQVTVGPVTPVPKKRISPLTSNMERAYLLEKTISAGVGLSRDRA